MSRLDSPAAALVSAIFWIVGSCLSTAEDPLIVQISDGKILGTQYVSSWTNKNVYGFFGIPFAAPPVADLRFKLPVPPTKWTVTKDCKSFGSACKQAMAGTSEDCLFLNVYSPELNPPGALAPVYVFFHGGGFLAGAGSWIGPEPMVAEGIVVVTANYRLGVFGFLTLGTSDEPGNTALFDQVLSLKWVKQEISKFGGDPNRVTIGGESAGSMMVHLHYISPVSKGLFHAAIAESGTSLVFTDIPDAPGFGLQLATLVNCSKTDISVTQQCLRSISADAILNAQSLVQIPAIDQVRSFVGPWGPIVDKDTNKDNPFQPASSAELIAQGQGSSVPFLMGANRDEGTVAYSLGVNQRLTTLASNIRYLIPSQVLEVSSNSSIQDKEQQIKTKYFGGKEPSVSNVLEYFKLIGDYSFDYPTAKSAQSFSNRSSVFLYSFEFYGSFRAKQTAQYNKQLNTSLVGHCDEMGYLYVVPVFSNQSYVDPNCKEMTTFNRMVKLWTNFIKYQTPTLSPDPLLQNVSWTPVGNNSLYYLKISDDLTMEQSDYADQTVQFWDEINAMPSPSSATTLFATLTALSILALVM